MKRNIRTSVWVAMAIGALAALPFTRAFAAEEGKPTGPRTVGKILEVKYGEIEVLPPTLVVSAKGEVPTGGYSNATLMRVYYVVPPADGIQDYFLTAVPPSGMATQQISEVAASNEWRRYKEEAPWIKGIRVHGIGGGVVETLFPAPRATLQLETLHPSTERTFTGKSDSGNLQEALDAALGQLGSALGDGGAADALANWAIDGVRGERGGFAGLHGVEVTIKATRSPAW